MKVIKKMQLAVVAVFVVGMMVMESRVEARGIEGMFVGARDGALVGEAIVREHGIARAALFFPPPPPLPPLVFSYNHSNHYENYRDEYRRQPGPSQGCWEETVRVEGWYGRYRDEVRTVCRDRGWRDLHHKPWRHEYHNRNRW